MKSSDCNVRLFTDITSKISEEFDEKKTQNKLFGIYFCYIVFVSLLLHLYTVFQWHANANMIFVWLYVYCGLRIDGYMLCIEYQYRSDLWIYLIFISKYNIFMSRIDLHFAFISFMCIYWKKIINCHSFFCHALIFSRCTFLFHTGH